MYLLILLSSLFWIEFLTFCCGLVIIIVILVIAAPISCLKCISCRCGSSNKNYTHCFENEVKKEQMCNTWAECQTCKENITHCITCPPKQFGPFCTEGDLEHMRRKRESLPIYSSTSCKNDGYIPNGRVTVMRSTNARMRKEEDDYELPVGTHLHYSCSEGYALNGTADLFCEDTGFWSEERPPTCIEIKCGSFKPVSNGKIFVSFTSKNKRRRTIDREGGLNYPMGTQLDYVCHDGYWLLGDKIVTCQKFESTGLWSADEPICIEDCGNNSLSSNPPMSVGTNTKPGEWPWTVAIAVKEKNTTMFLCSGVLLDRRTVLTVAHCVGDARDYILYFGIFRLDPETKDSRVCKRRHSRIILHRDFDKKTYENDIALVTFTRPVRYSVRIRPICLPTPESTERNFVAGKEGFISGWEVGTYVTKEHTPKELSVIQIPAVSKRSCTLSFRKKGARLNITEGMFCAGLKEGVAGFCSMSTGSPMVFYDENQNRFTLEGLVSWGVGPACGKRENYNVLTRVATFMQWILSNSQVWHT